MARGAPKKKHGHMPCPDCGEKVVVKINPESKTLSYSCDECDGTGYCKAGEGRYAIWTKKIVLIAPPGGAHPPAPVPGKDEKPAPPAARRSAPPGFGG